MEFLLAIRKVARMSSDGKESWQKCTEGLLDSKNVDLN